MSIPKASARRLSCASSTHLRECQGRYANYKKVEITVDPLFYSQRSHVSLSCEESHVSWKNISPLNYTKPLFPPITSIPFATLAFLCLIYFEDAIYSASLKSKSWMPAYTNTFVCCSVQISCGRRSCFLRAQDDALKRSS